jgi:hypothetical protein
MLFHTIAVFASMAQIGATPVDIQINHMRPSKMLRLIHQVTPFNVTVKAFDAEGVLRVMGAQDQVEEVRRYISIHDVRPAEISFSYEVYSPLDKARFSSNGIALHDTRTTIEHEAVDLKMSLTPRLNADNTITVFIRLTHESMTNTLTFRVRQNQGMMISPSADGLKWSNFPHLPNLPEEFRIVLRFTTIEPELLQQRRRDTP